MSWRLAAPVVTWGVAGVVVAVIGILAGRPSVAVLGLPLLLGLGWGVRRPPAAAASARLRGADQSAGSGRLRATVEIASEGPRSNGSGRPTVGVRVHAIGHRPVEVLMRSPEGGTRAVPVEMRSVRTGRRALFRLDHRLSSADGLWSTPAATAEPLTVTVLPGVRPLEELPVPLRLHGSSGPHQSRRPGVEAEFRDVAPFAAGDRTRRIDWRVTTRLNTRLSTGASRISQLYVRRSFATAEATVMLVIDSRDQVGPRVVSWADSSALREAEATSLDIARSAAASLSDRYLAGGDRVGLEDLGRVRRPVPPAAGRQQQRRLVQRLALAEPDREPTPRRRVPRLPAGSAIVVLSTFLDDDSATMALAWHGAGHRVLAVDTLPSLDLTGATPRLLTAFRLVDMERRDRLAALRRAGVNCFPWSGGLLDPAIVLGLEARDRVRR